MEFLPKEDTIVSEFMIKGTKYCALTEWKDRKQPDMFHMMLFDGDCCWTGKYTMLLADQFRKEVGETAEEYYNNVRESLLTENGNSSFEISWYLSPDCIMFGWKRNFEHSSYVVHGLLPMHRNKEESQCKIVDFLIDENALLKSIAKDLDRRTYDMKREMEKYTGDLDKFVASKSVLETNVYAQIVKLVSAKKERIQKIQEDIGRVNIEMVDYISDD